MYELPYFERIIFFILVKVRRRKRKRESIERLDRSDCESSEDNERGNQYGSGYRVAQDHGENFHIWIYRKKVRYGRHLYCRYKKVQYFNESLIYHVMIYEASMLLLNLYESIVAGSYFLSINFLIFFFILNIFVFYFFPLGVVTDIFLKRSFVFLDSLILFIFLRKSKRNLILQWWWYNYHIYNIYILIIIIIYLYIQVFAQSPLQNIMINVSPRGVNLNIFR